MPRDRIEDLPPHPRRSFFAASLARALAPLAEYLEERIPALPLYALPLLRPPGALPEARFLETCLRCGNCVEACPADAIRRHEGPDPPLKGTPLIDADRAACVVCDELACMRVCPSGALTLVDRHAIRMGLAVLDQAICLRAHGEDCTICVDRCPLGATAIRIERGRVEVVAPNDRLDGIGEGCVGCGVCQLYCPTHPKAIRVEPRQ